MMAQTKTVLVATVGIALLAGVGLVAGGQMSTGDYSFEADLPLVIGNAGDTFQYDGEGVRALEGSASFQGNTERNTGRLVAVVTTEDSGPIVVSEGRSLEGAIRIVMEQFVGPYDYRSGGLAEAVLMHGDTGLMSAVMPELYAHLVGWGLLDVYEDGVLVYEDLSAHFMVTERIRRGESEGYQIRRDGDGAIYRPALIDKTGFAFSSQRELHLWAGSPVSGGPFVHLNFLLTEEVVGFGGEAPPPGQPPDDSSDGGSSGGPKGNNGIGNGEDGQPPGNPPINDDEDSVSDGNASGGKGKGKNK